MRRCWLPSKLIPAGTALLLFASTSALGAARPSAIARATRSVVTVQTGSELGTAFAYGAPGSFITAAHVVGSSRVVVLSTSDGATARGIVVRADDGFDLAEIRAPLALTPLPPDPESVNPGDPVYAIGTPLRPGISGSAINGVVSAIRPDAQYGASVQSDTPLNPGDSGGPLLDAKGRVIAVNEAKLTQATGVSFSIPISHAAELGQEPPGTHQGAASLPPTALTAGGTVIAILLAAIALGVRARRRDTVRVTLRDMSMRQTFEPDTRVQLKQAPSVEVPNKRT